MLLIYVIYRWFMISIRRIVRYARLVGPESVIAGTDCGFKILVRTNPAIAPEVVWPKLQAMAEGTRLASQEFW